MATTLCDGMDTPKMVATLVEDSFEVLFNQPPIDQIFVAYIHVDHLLVDQHVDPLINGLHVGRIHVGQSPIMVVPPWHVIVTKL
jgi:hypothetical protein